jgi:hypothetical protein
MIRELRKVGGRVVQTGIDMRVAGQGFLISENLTTTLPRSRQALRWSC